MKKKKKWRIITVNRSHVQANHNTILVSKSLALVWQLMNSKLLLLDIIRIFDVEYGDLVALLLNISKKNFLLSPIGIAWVCADEYTIREVVFFPSWAKKMYMNFFQAVVMWRCPLSALETGKLIGSKNDLFFHSVFHIISFWSNDLRSFYEMYLFLIPVVIHELFPR